ncbi:hypothetical protein NC796_05175 [Aliifodinibius sp. S!AR15-10]|uniref:MutS-related protein n=1 Tax=Aliifodinibius sp. S!AR15-10 TaxID=2950437 RepID=UPI0028553C49|nr:hypothetical protein [Aliifodinibius sp. S!AR15-10]MDR8390522.1 hypothetical protein [Aliifodinibius sp. S!AR15-10]
MSTQRSTLRQAINNQLRRIEAKINIVNKWDSRISRYRLGVFAAGIVALYFAAQTGSPTITLLVLGLFVVGFMWLVSRHQKVEKQQKQLRIWEKIRSTHLARMDLEWEQVPYPQSAKPEPDHPYAGDLNITGQHSLLHLVDTAIYNGGSEQLKQWLLANNPDVEQVIKRQQLVRELTPMAHFRDRLQLRAAISKSYESEQDWDMQELLKWLAQPSTTSYTKALTLLGSLAALNWILGILYLAGILPPYIFFSFVLYMLAYNFNSDKVKGLFDASYQMEKLLSRFSEILIYLEEYPYKKGSKLEEFCELYQQEETRPSRFLKKIVRLAAAASSQKSEIVWAILNLLVPWDLYFSYKLDRYKTELKDPLKRWLDHFYKLEALCSLANFGWLNPHYILAKPDQDRTEPVLKATDLGHPLIPHQQKVTNDVTIEKNGSLILVTGSNMSGKSTFLRILGINLCLCLSGGPVNASSFKAIPFRLFTSINVVDSLDEGLSHFYAEVRKLRRLLNELERKDAWPLFFLVDEIFRGTNNRERLIGSTAFLKHVAGTDGVGVVSTHDLELASLEEEIPQLSNWHFEETIRDGKMSFEYKLKPGPCPTTNALTIMEMEGLPVGKD